MSAPPVPPAIAALADEHNVAADATLIEALPFANPGGQSALMRVLLSRDHVPSLAGVVGRFSEYDEGLQRLILEHAGDLSAAVRRAVEAPDLRDRAGAIEVVVRSRCGSLVYLLADALRSPCHQTRELAATGLRRLAETLLDRPLGPAGATDSAGFARLAAGLTEALGRAVAMWEVHLQPKVLEAALWISDRAEPVIRQKLQEPRTKIARVLNEILTGATDPRLAGFTVQALAMPPLRVTAAQTIGRATDPAFIRAVLAQTPLLADAEIERGCRRIPSTGWLRGGPDEILQLDADLIVRALRWVAAAGGSPQRKMAAYRELIGLEREDLRQAVVWQLVEDNSEAATDLLSMVANRFDDRSGRIAGRELRRRRPPEPTVLPVDEGTEVSALGTATRRVFEEYWPSFDQASAEHLAQWEEAMQADPGALLGCLRAKLAAGSPSDRRRALGIVRALGLTADFPEQVFGLAHDPDPTVRSQAVGMLADLPGRTGRRILRQAVHDRDERVQANAIEALDLLEVDDRVEETKSSLESPNSRVRANAIKSLLRLEMDEAGDALLDMLEASSRSHRLSALWVVEKLGLRAVIHRIEALARQDPDDGVRRRAGRVLGEFGAGFVAHLATKQASPGEPGAAPVGGRS